MANVRLGVLIVDFSINPRKSKNADAVETYKDSLLEYKEKADGDPIDKWFPKSWNQRIEITSDHIVTQGCHTVLGLREIYDDDTIIPAFYMEIEGKPAKGKADAAWLACQSNKKGLAFGDIQKSEAALMMIKQMQPTQYTQEEGKRPYMTDRALAVAIGCSKSTVSRVRNAWLIENGYKKPKPTHNLAEAAKRAEAIMEQMENGSLDVETPKVTLANSRQKSSKKNERDIPLLYAIQVNRDDVKIGESSTHELKNRYREAKRWCRNPKLLGVKLVDRHNSFEENKRLAKKEEGYIHALFSAEGELVYFTPELKDFIEREMGPGEQYLEDL